MSLYITGDCHGEFSRFHSARFQPDDIVIIAGDMGLPWGEENFYGIGGCQTLWSYQDRQNLRMLRELPCQFLFIDGNHENFDLLRDIPCDASLYGGTARKLADNIYHLSRGRIYTILGKTFFTMGGATSVDRRYRRERISWWPEEIPSYAEWEEAFAVLDRQGWKVDYVVTHTCPNEFLHGHKDFTVWPDICPVRQMLDRIRGRIEYGWWFFGHFHEDHEEPEQRCTWLYRSIKKLF